MARRNIHRKARQATSGNSPQPEGHSPSCPTASAALRTVFGIRLENYKRLLLEFRDSPHQRGLPQYGLLTRFAEASGVNARYLSHVSNGRKNIGDALARQLEAGMNKPVGWMDNDHSSSPATDAEGQFLAVAAAMFRRSPVSAQAALLQYMLDQSDTAG
jgi:hypothetical protein